MIEAMDRERLHKIESVFDRVVAAPEPERVALLDAECGDDRDLRAEVSLLLASDAANPDGAIRGVVAAEAGRLSAERHALAIGKRLGPYRIGAVLGEGGMGTVYGATRDDAEFAKDVAIKVLAHAMGSSQA